MTLVLAALVASDLGLSGQAGDRPAVYVVALKDSGVLTMCPSLREATMASGQTWKSDGRAMVNRFTDDLQLLRFPRRESPPDERRASRQLQTDPRFRTERSATRAILPIPRPAAGGPSALAGTELGRTMISPDVELKQTVERELARLGTHEVVSSVGEADLVLLIEGRYTSLAASSTTDTGSSAQTGPPPGRSSQLGDWQRNLLESVLAVAVPAEVYRASPGDIPALLSARIWEGSEVYQAPDRVAEGTRTAGPRRWDTYPAWEPASAEALLWQFSGMKPRPPSHPPLCAVSSQTFQVPAAAPSAAIVPIGSPGARHPAASSPQESTLTLSFTGGVTYVTVPVSVIDRDGRAVIDLSPTRFRVYEDEVPQVIDRVARPGGTVTVILLVDTSSSMRRALNQTHAVTVAAARAFGRLGAPVMVSFDRRVVLHSTLSDSRTVDRPAIDQATAGRTATRFYDAIHLVLAGPSKVASVRTALVILTDGVDTASRLADADTVLRQLGESHIPAYVIRYDTAQDSAPLPPNGGIGLSVNGEAPDLTRRLLPEDARDPGPVYARAADFLRDIAGVSGGRVIAAPPVDALDAMFAQIASELNQQFVVTYYPRNQARDGSYRRIRVEVDGSALTVRARRGYYQPTDGGR